MSLRPHVSVVIPLLNEAENVADLYRELTTHLESLGRPYEVLMVDDGSTDGTVARLVEIEARDPRIRVLRLRRNFGQTAAFSAGFDHARGDLVVTSDGDLQNDPADIPRLIERLETGGLDMVCGWRFERQDPWHRRLPSQVANRVISMATGVRLNDYGCSLKVMRAEVVRGIRLYGEMHRFIPAVASWMGVTVAEMKVNHRPRTRGSSKYGIGRTTRVLLDLFTVKFLLAYGTRPAHLFGRWGLMALFGGGAILTYLAVQKIFLDEAIGPRLPLLMLGVLAFLSGFMLLNVGLLAELLVRIYHESQGKRIYVVREILPGDAAQPLAEEPEPEPTGAPRGR
jgi:glycosyltransferase involved in cell wall biosynthesis